MSATFPKLAWLIKLFIYHERLVQVEHLTLKPYCSV